MQFARIDVCFDEHPSNAWMNLAEGGLHKAAILYCNRIQTDGFVPEHQLRRFGDPGEGEKAVVRLLERGRWTRGEKNGEPGYWIVRYLDHNESRKQIQAKVEAKRIAGQRGGERSGQRRQARSEEPTKADTQVPAKQTLEQLPSTCPADTQAPAQANAKQTPSEREAKTNTDHRSQITDPKERESARAPGPSASGIFPSATPVNDSEVPADEVVVPLPPPLPLIGPTGDDDPPGRPTHRPEAAPPRHEAPRPVPAITPRAAGPSVAAARREVRELTFAPDTLPLSDEFIQRCQMDAQMDPRPQVPLFLAKMKSSARQSADWHAELFAWVLRERGYQASAKMKLAAGGGGYGRYPLQEPPKYPTLKPPRDD